MTKTTRLLFALPALAALLAAPGCGAIPFGACTLIGCQSGATITLPMTQGEMALAGATVELCQNNVCHSALVSKVPPEDNRIESLSFASGAAARGALWREASGYTLELEWVVDRSTLHDGDRYTVKVTDAGGHSIAQLDKVAAYTTTQPNGATCPPTCTNVALAN